MKAMLAMTPSLIPFVFGTDAQARLAELVRIDFDRPLDLDHMDAEELADVELLVTGWGVPSLRGAALGRLPSLRAVVHWGGGVGFLDDSASARGVAISSARSANAIPVAEFTLAMITLGSKDVFWSSRHYSREQRAIDREKEYPHSGLYRSTVGIVGASTIGALVMEELKSRDLDVLLYDPTATQEKAVSLGAELVADLHELASRSSILSVHAPDLPQTRGMISASVITALPDGATLINTARGALIDQTALVEQLRAGRIRAILDVTDPEVLPPGHELYSLPNVFLTPHLAGSMGSELRRLGAVAVAEIERLVAGDPFAHPIAP